VNSDRAGIGALLECVFFSELLLTLLELL
jgi:hypothetical protein